jgi:hypothetical protein
MSNPFESQQATEIELGFKYSSFCKHFDINYFVFDPSNKLYGTEKK